MESLLFVSFRVTFSITCTHFGASVCPRARARIVLTFKRVSRHSWSASTACVGVRDNDLRRLTTCRTAGRRIKHVPPCASWFRLHEDLERAACTFDTLSSITVGHVHDNCPIIDDYVCAGNACFMLCRVLYERRTQTPNYANQTIHVPFGYVFSKSHWEFISSLQICFSFNNVRNIVDGSVSGHLSTCGTRGKFKSSAGDILYRLYENCRVFRKGRNLIENASLVVY